MSFLMRSVTPCASKWTCKIKTFNLPSGCLFGIPLGEEDLRNFEGGAYQVHSNASIIVCDGNNIYKYIIDIQEESSMRDLLESCPQKLFTIRKTLLQQGCGNTKKILCLPHQNVSNVKGRGKKMPSKFGRKCY